MAPAQGDAGASSSTRLGRILLVDDQAQNRDMLGRRLERRGYDVVLRENAVDIEQVIETQGIELVLLDWIMPERSGHDALKGIRALYDAEHVPVIVVTALDDGDIVSTALEAGANDYISKPIDLRVLTARVKAQLDRRQAVLELDAIRDNLEKTVQQRTQDLMSANETLSAEISEREAAEARAQSLARHDPLTGLANRRHFLEELDRRLGLVGNDATAFALMFVDLDRFKPINDVHGHAIGDQLLQVIATRLAGCIRDDSSRHASAATNSRSCSKIRAAVKASPWPRAGFCTNFPRPFLSTASNSPWARRSALRFVRKTAVTRPICCSAATPPCCGRRRTAAPTNSSIPLSMKP
jgi:PleD family two-component response regulator